MKGENNDYEIDEKNESVAHHYSDHCSCGSSVSDADGICPGATPWGRWRRQSQRWRRKERPRIRDALKQIENDYGLFLPFATLLRGTATQDFQEGSSKRRYLGLHDVEGTACHHVLFLGDVVDWQLWIAADGDPLLRKMVVTYKEIEGAPQYATVITEFVANPPLEDALFAAQLPAGSVRAEPLKIVRRKP